MVEVTTTPSASDMERINRVLSSLVANTGRSAFQSVMYAANMISQSGRANSKPSRVNREVERNPVFVPLKMRKNTVVMEGRELLDLTGVQAIAARSRYMIAVDTQKHGRKWWYTNRRDDPKVKVPRRGTARHIWDIMAAKFASAQGDMRNTDKYMDVLGAHSPTASMALVHNKLSYLEAAYPGQAAVIIDKSMSRIEKRIEQLTDRDVETANRG